MLFKKRLTPEQFWDWFSREESRLFGLDQQAFHGEFTKQLWRYDKELAWEMSIEEGVRELAISADGISSSIASVKRLVGAAPQLLHHKIVAFRQPKDSVGTIELHGHTISSDTVLFDPIDSKLPLSMRLYIPGLNGRQPHSNEDKQLIHCAFILLDSAVGELAMMTQIAGIDFLPLVEGASRQTALPILELPALLKRLEAEG